MQGNRSAGTPIELDLASPTGARILQSSKVVVHPSDLSTARTDRALLYVIGSLDIGGTERQLLLLAREVSRRGVPTYVFALDGTGPLRTELEQAGVTVLDGGFRSQGGLWHRIGSLTVVQARLILATIRLRPSVVHAFLPLANFFGALVGRVAGVERVITSRRGLGTHQERYKPWRLVDRIAHALSDVVTANSRAVVADAVRRERVDPTKFVLVYNGVERSCNGSRDLRPSVRASLGLKDEDTALINVGNLIPYKGQADLLEALQQVVARVPRVHLFIAGEDRNGWQRVLEQKAQALALSHLVHFLGRRSDIQDLFDAMDLAVFASHEEGFSNAILEAMAAGVPIVATDVGGNREALDHGRAGRLVPPKCAPAMAEAICESFVHSDRAHRKAQFAKARVESQFSVSAMVDQFCELYGLAITERAPGE